MVKKLQNSRLKRSGTWKLSNDRVIASIKKIPERFIVKVPAKNRMIRGFVKLF